MVELDVFLLEVEANFVAIDDFVLEADNLLPDLERILGELEFFPIELDVFLVALKDLLIELVSTFVEVDARFEELEARFVELVDLPAELDTTLLVTLEPRIGLVSRDEVATLLDVLAILMEDDARLELEDPLLEPDPCVEVVGS